MPAGTAEAVRAAYLNGRSDRTVVMAHSRVATGHFGERVLGSVPHEAQPQSWDPYRDVVLVWQGVWMSRRVRPPPCRVRVSTKLTVGFRTARHQRCRVHKIADVANALPKSALPDAKKARQEICHAEDRDHALKAVTPFARSYGVKFPKAVKHITDDVDELLAFYDFPAKPRIHLRTPNPIESTFATGRLRTKVTRGAGNPAAASALVFKLVESAQQRW